MSVFHRARIRLTLRYVALTGGLLVVFCAVCYAGLHVWLWRRVDGLLMQQRGWVARLIDEEVEHGKPNWGEVESDLRELPVRGGGVFVVQVCAPDGRVLFAHHVPRDGPPLPLSRTLTAYCVTRGPLRGHRALTGPMGNYVVTVAASTAETRSFLASVRLVFALSVPVLLAVAGLAGWMFAGRALQPAYDAYDLMQRFTADAAHELRSPVTAVQGECDVALRRLRDAGEYREALVNVSAQAEMMGRLLANLLLLTRADANQEGLRLQALSLGQLVGQQMELLRPSAEQRGVSMHADIQADVPVMGDDLRLRQLAANLVGNAIKFADERGEVRVVVERRGREAVLEVTDTGPGIAPEHLPHIFERFYRADRSRSGESSGSGLGLSICQWIAEAHGGRIEVASRPGEGARFTVSLPIT